ncbi:DUF4383 domain-containing protein [Candidatus Peregrinibacteria bacterium]|nr:DUF4383 domain-containing protein [Candidatus Peregrinibacteria bacterium]
MAVTLAWVLGLVLTLVGVLGFFNDPVLGIFEVDPVHNVIHLLSGLVGLFAASKGMTYARQYLIVFGLIYAVVTVLGFTMESPLLGLVSVNDWDNYLHAAIAAVSLLVGFSGKKS